MTNNTQKLKPATVLVARGRSHTPGSPLNVPIVPASNFVLGDDAEYARDTGTPTWHAFEEVVGAIEGGHALAFSSGMAAAAAVFDQLPTGAKVLIPTDCYQGVVGLANAGVKKNQWDLHTVPLSHTGAWVEGCKDADLIWVESPSNPLLEIADLETICGAPRKQSAILCVDNTFATFLNQRPLQLGADLSMHSATKSIGGHSDLLAGVLIADASKHWEVLNQTRLLTGATPGALETFLALRGLRTMTLRVRQAEQNAIDLAERLEKHERVEKVRYPGLPSHPDHELACRQLQGFGTIISFDVIGGAEPADQVCASTELIQHATSLGGVESTMERRANNPGQEHLPPGLLRISVGIEDVEDLWKDLEYALTLS